MSNESKRVQVPMSRNMRDLLRDWAAELSKAKDEEIGTGSVAAMLIEEIIKRPDLVHELLFETQRGEGQGEANVSATAKKASGKR